MAADPPAGKPKKRDRLKEKQQKDSRRQESRRKDQIIYKEAFLRLPFLLPLLLLEKGFISKRPSGSLAPFPKKTNM
ncbi:hypothetical protein B4135_2916 [Caldibacillus debilis]|uniref:Uncharacterized protein n=1 Tax=Caldibacillus debilis TaxID=301148 RepID=A0A150LLM6_9BACI|nr:hypothetical protein B4135_2916 [Caldibacillus debilis]